MHRLENLFANNRDWARRKVNGDPEFFRRLCDQQSPRYLWIGCADSRVPANEIVGLLPGELFVHRNVANLVVHTDLNCLSVLQFAVDVLRVEHVIVCGHYGCGGIEAAALGRSYGLIDNWLRHVADVYTRYQSQLESPAAVGSLTDRLCELNVLEQALHVCQTTIVQDAWRRSQPLWIHGVVYSLKDGLLRDLEFEVSRIGEAVPRFESAVLAVGRERRV
jgi:carbonic anhydrase